MPMAMQCGGIGGELSDDFFQDVLERDQALQIPVLIDHQCDAPSLALKVMQLSVECRAFRNEVRLARQRNLQQAFARERRLRQCVRHLFHMQDTDHLIQTALVNRQPRMWTGAQLFEHVVPVGRDIDACDIVARNHQIVDGDFLQIQDTHQHALMPVRDQCAGLCHYGAQLFGAQRMRCRAGCRNAEQSQYAIRQ